MINKSITACILLCISVLMFQACAAHSKTSYPETPVPEIVDEQIQSLQKFYTDKLDSPESNRVREEIRTRAGMLEKMDNSPDSLYLAYSILRLLDESIDSLKIESLRNSISTVSPGSEFTFRIASDEFYDRIYPVWAQDSAKVIIINELLKKYPATQWRRTMYQYLVSSLNRLGNLEAMYTALENWRRETAEDYLPFHISAAMMMENKGDLRLAQKYAGTASRLGLNQHKPAFYPPEEWNLEKRAIRIKTTAVLAEILIHLENYAQADEVIRACLNEPATGVEDEITEARLYYLLAAAEKSLGNDSAEKHAAEALVLGDSRQKYTMLADSLYRKITGLEKTSDQDVVEHVRNLLDYNDVIFTDVTQASGLADVNAGRIAWGDYNRDGYQDILLNGSRLFRNNKGQNFIDVTEKAFPEGISANGGLWGDLDNDGDLDLVTKEPEWAWLNTKGVFEKVHTLNGYRDNEVSTEGLGLGDVNGDGFLDIYVANYEKDYIAEKDQLFFGIDDGRFRDVTEFCQISPETDKHGRGVNLGDYDNDGDLDIFVSNYRLSENFLWENVTSGRFQNVALEKGVAGVEVDGWWGHTIGSEWADYDNDGDLDLFTANLAHPRYIDFSNKSMLYTNSGAPAWQFHDVRSQAGIVYEETHSEPAWGDLNNDGWLDLYINDVYEGRRSFLYMSNADETFRDVTYLAGVRHFNGWGVAFADFDRDGDLDILAAGGTIQLFRNESAENGNWIVVEIVARKHVDGIGARMTLTDGESTWIREVQGGKGTTNQHSLLQHFGLGENTGPFKLMIKYPAGREVVYDVNKVNRYYRFEE